MTKESEELAEAMTKALERGLAPLVDSVNELGRQFRDLRGEVVGMRGEVVGMREEVDGLRVEVGELRGWVRAELDGMRSYLDQRVADVIRSNTRAVDALGKSLELDSKLADIARRVAELEARRDH